MLQQLFQTNNDWPGLIARVVLGLVILPHGAQHLLGWFGGFGFTGTMNYFTQVRHLPWIISFLVIMIEFFGSIGLIAGVASRLLAFAMIVLMLGIVFSTHWQHGFFMDWYGKNPEPFYEGYEFHILAIGLALVVLVTGGGKWSLDSKVLGFGF